ncbi:MAG: ATP-binding protein [Gammaproteobacteria bacterium]|nr:ATP-binding protein [Gammaproteobacteria bacterium]
MKIKTKIALYLAGILALMGAALVFIGYWIISQIIVQQYETQLSRELNNLVIEVRQAHDTLARAGILELEAYVIAAQKRLFDKFSTYHFGETGHLDILEGDPLKVHHLDHDYAHGLEIDLQDIQQPTGQIRFSADGRNFFGLYQTAGIWDWTLVLALDEQEMFASRKQYITYVSIVAAITFLILILLSRLLSFRTARRIDSTVNTLELMESGDYSKRFASDINDEIGQIEHAVNSLISKIGDEISKREKTEVKLRVAKEMAEMASKAKSEFLSAMSHEIRTPMNGVIGTTSLLAKTQLNEEQEHFVDIIEHSADAMMHVINDILDFSKLESGTIELEKVDIDLPQLAQEVINLFSADAAKKDITLEQHFASKGQQVFSGDYGRIRQILMNLVNNALKFTNQGSISINITVEESKHEESLVHFEVEDSGIGIAQEKLSSLFDSFVQADASVTRKYGGTGLGLSICKKLVDAMNGNIGVDSIRGKGSRFWFNLALEKMEPSGDETTASAEVAEIPEADQTQMKILVVEDVLPNQLVARKILEKLGHEVDIADNGLNALDVLDETNYDLIFMDLSMPEMDGITATKNIRSLNPEIAKVPIIAMTANATEEDRAECLQAGMDDFISKPVTIEKIKLCLDQWQDRLGVDSSAVVG